MSSEGVGADFFRVSIGPSPRRGPGVVIEQDVSELVGQSTTLPHRIFGSCDRHHYYISHRIAHRHPVLIEVNAENGHIDSLGQFDQRNKIT